MPDVNMKANIAEALFKLSQTKNIDKITVKDLVTECNISRQSFYYHFQDIFDVSEWSLRQEMLKTLQKSSNVETPQEAIYIFIHKMIENQFLIRKLYTSDHRERLEKIMIQTIRDYIQSLIQHKVKGSRLSHQDLDFLLDFYSLGLTEYMMLHINEDIDEKYLSEQLFRLMDGQLNIFQ